MSDSLTTATPEKMNATPTEHPPVRENQRAVEAEVEQGAIAEQRIMRSIGGGSPAAHPDLFAGTLVQVQGSSQVGMLRQLQRSYGNSYVGRVIQAKLKSSNDVSSVDSLSLPSTESHGAQATQRIGSANILFRQPSIDSQPTQIRTLASAAQTGQPSRSLPAPNGEKSIDVYETSAACQAADLMGAFAFTYRDSIFLGRNPGIPGAPSTDEVLRHEMAHVFQSRQKGSVADRHALELQASEWRGGNHLLAADPEEVYQFLWVPFVIAFGYILLKPNTANAPGPGDKTYKSMDTKDYGKMVAEAVLFASGGLVTSSLRKAGYSAVATWGISGASGSIAYRGVQDSFAGSFSGIDAYVVDGLTGATIGVVVGGTFQAIGKVPGISRAKEWFMRGAENDEVWANLSWKDKLRYEIGQKTLASADEFAKVSQLSPVERGAQFVEEQGWLKALFPSSPKFIPGTGGTFSTGPTPGARWFFRSTAGFGSGAIGNYLLGDRVHGAWGTGMESYGNSSDARVFGTDLGEEWGNRQQGASDVPVIIVVPEGEELNYLMKSGRLGDFPVPDGTSGLRDNPNEFSPSNRSGNRQPLPDMMG